MKKRFILITGRTSSQAIAMHKGKTTADYRAAVARADMNSADMDELGLVEGEPAWLKNTDYLTDRELSIEIPIFKGDLPRGMVFMPMGPEANRLIPGETLGVGMPAYKDQMVEVVKS